METITAINNPAPVAQADRIKTIDMIRGFALLGILLMNIPGFGFNWDGWYRVLHGPHDTKDYYTMAAIFSFFDGTMRGLFSMLFGAGMILFTQNKKELPDGPSVTEFYYRRLLWLLLFGMFNAFILLWFGDILYFYAVCGMLLFVFRKTSPKWLFVLAIITMSITMYKTQDRWSEAKEKRVSYLEAVKAEKDSVKLTAEQTAAKAEWLDIERRRKEGPDTTFTNRNLRKMQSGYGTIFTYWIPMNVDGETNGLYQQWFWDGLTMMFVGMALLGLGFFSNKLSTSTYTMSLLIGYGIGLPLGYLLFKKGIVLEISDFNYYLDRYRTSPDLLYDLRRGLISVGHASLLMLIYRSKIVPWLMKALANVGQMAFTNYLMQSIICTWFFYGYGFGYYNKLSFHQLYYVVFSVWVFQLIFSSIWLRYFRFGPFEWVWRSLTYWKKQPMRR
jgi:uncharacterized protein